MICNNIAGFNFEYHLHLKALVNFITENSFDAHVLLTFLTTTAENGGFSTKNNLAEVAALFSYNDTSTKLSTRFLTKFIFYRE